MSKFLALIVACAMALFIAGPAMAQEWTVEKSYTFDKDNIVTGDTDIRVRKDIDISVDGDLDATGGIEVQGDVVFKEMDVQVQDEEVVNKFFELDDSASSAWSTGGNGLMFAAEQLQNGLNNTATIIQDDISHSLVGMEVGLQYQVGDANTAFLFQPICSPEMNNFAKQIQVGNNNTAIGAQ